MLLPPLGKVLLFTPPQKLPARPLIEDLAGTRTAAIDPATRRVGSEWACILNRYRTKLIRCSVVLTQFVSNSQ